MKITGTVSVTCPVCGETAEHSLVQMVNPRADPASAEKLMRGELNVAVCRCGKRTQLAATFVFHDPEAKIFCHVCPEGEPAMQRAEAAFDSAFGSALAASAASTDALAGPGASTTAAAGGLQRIVPSQNALVEKLKIAEAGLEDWAIEMMKVLLLASISIDDDDRVMLFSRLDAGEGRVHWLLFDPHGEIPSAMASPIAAYHRLLATCGGPPPPTQRRIDRTWAIEAVRQMIASGN